MGSDNKPEDDKSEEPAHKEESDSKKVRERKSTNKSEGEGKVEKESGDAKVAQKEEKKEDKKNSEGSKGAAEEDAGSGLLGLLIWLVMVVVLVGAIALGTLLVMGPEPPAPGAGLQGAPSSVLSHQISGRYIKVKAGDTQMSLFVRTEGNKDARETVLLMHGAGTSSYIYRNVIKPLAGHGTYVVAVDLPGSGLSDKPSSVDLSETGLAEVLNKLIGVMSLRPVHLVVHDTAGPVGGVLANKYPHRVRSLFFLDSPMPSPLPPSLPLWLASLPGADRMIAALPPALYHQALKSCCSKTLSMDDAEGYMFLMQHNGGVGALGQQMSQMYTSSLSAPEILAVIKSRQLPVHVFWAADVGQGHLQSQADLTRGLEVTTAHEFGSGVGKWSPEDAPEELAQMLAAFVDTLPPTPRHGSDADDMPEHVKKQFEDMEAKGETGCSGHSHDHGGHGGHSHGHDHGGHSHGHSGHSHNHGGHSGHSHAHNAGHGHSHSH